MTKSQQLTFLYVFSIDFQIYKLNKVVIQIFYVKLYISFVCLFVYYN